MESKRGNGKYETALSVGGIAGVGATIRNCYNTGTITNYDIKGNAIASTGTCTDCYYLANSGNSKSGAISLSEGQMRIESMYKNFDFENTWTLNEFANHPYPQLINNIQDLSESAGLVSIVALPSKTEYFIGDKLDFTGSMVKVVYVSGREEIVEITDGIVSGFDMNTVGEQTVTVTIAGAYDTFTINVKARPEVKSLTMIFGPDKKEFVVGTSFDFSGAKAQVTYVDGTVEYIDITADMTTGGNVDHIGKQLIVYTIGGKSVSFEIEVIGISLEKIQISALPDKTEYLEGQDFDPAGMVVTAIMSDGTQNTIGSGYRISGYTSVPGTHTITVKYLEKTATFDIAVVARTLKSLVLNTLPDKLEYISGQSFDSSGMQLIAIYDNGDTEVVENYEIEGFDNETGIKNITLSYGGKSVSFPVKVVARVITDFRISKLPTKLEYIEYESFDMSGLKVEATFNDGVTEEIKDYELSGLSSTVGTHTIAIAYEGFVETFEITVHARILEDVKITVPNKLSYYLNEAFDPVGMEVIACYNNGQKTPVDSYSIEGFDSKTPGTKEIVVIFEGISRSFAITVTEKTPVITNGSVKVLTVKGRLSETVQVPVTITQNPGLSGFCHTVTYDPNDLKFVAVTAENGFKDGTVVLNDENANEGKITIVWFQPTDVKESGTAYTLEFTVLEGAEDGMSEVCVDFNQDGNGNASGEDIVFTPVNGGVEVLSYWLGDLNGDRKYAMVDLLQLAQFVAGKEMTLTAKQLLSADVNEDGVINIHDVTLLSQWLLNAPM